MSGDQLFESSFIEKTTFNLPFCLSGLVQKFPDFRVALTVRATVGPPRLQIDPRSILNPTSAS